MILKSTWKINMAEAKPQVLFDLNIILDLMGVTVIRPHMGSAKTGERQGKEGKRGTNKTMRNK